MLTKIAIARIRDGFKCHVPDGEILKPGFNLWGRYAHRGLFDHQGVLYGIHCDLATTIFEVVERNIDLLSLYQQSYERHKMGKHAPLAVHYMEGFLSAYLPGEVISPRYPKHSRR